MKQNPKMVVIVIYVRANLTSGMMQETETALGDLLGVEGFGPGRPRTGTAGIQMSTLGTDTYRYSPSAVRQARKGFLQVDREKSAECSQVKTRVIHK